MRRAAPKQERSQYPGEVVLYGEKSSLHIIPDANAPSHAETSFERTSATFEVIGEPHSPASGAFQPLPKEVHRLHAKSHNPCPPNDAGRMLLKAVLHVSPHPSAASASISCRHRPGCMRAAISSLVVAPTVAHQSKMILANTGTSAAGMKAVGCSRMLS